MARARQVALPTMWSLTILPKHAERAERGAFRSCAAVMAFWEVYPELKNVSVKEDYVGFTYLGIRYQWNKITNADLRRLMRTIHAWDDKTAEWPEEGVTIRLARKDSVIKPASHQERRSIPDEVRQLKAEGRSNLAIARRLGVTQARVAAVTDRGQTPRAGTLDTRRKRYQAAIKREQEEMANA